MPCQNCGACKWKSLTWVLVHRLSKFIIAGGSLIAFCTCWCEWVVYFSIIGALLLTLVGFLMPVKRWRAIRYSFCSCTLAFKAVCLVSVAQRERKVASHVIHSLNFDALPVSWFKLPKRTERELERENIKKEKKTGREREREEEAKGKRGAASLWRVPRNLNVYGASLWCTKSSPFVTF